MISVDPAVFERLEAALREGRLADFRTAAEELDAALDRRKLRARLADDPALARTFLNRSQRLGAAAQYAASVVQALATVGISEAYGPSGGSASPPRSAGVRLEA